MTHPEITLLGMDWQGAVLTGAVLLVCLWEGQPPTTITPLMRKGYLLIPPPLRSHFIRGGVAGEIEVTRVVVTLMTLTSGGRWKKKDGFSSKIQIPEFGGKKGHPHDVADVFRQWAHCITYYREYYEDSYLMPLVVLSLTGDTSDMFDWTCSLSWRHSRFIQAPADVRGTLLWFLHFYGAEEHGQEPMPGGS